MKTLQTILDNMADARKAELLLFNEQHKPVAELEEDGITIGLFRFADGLYTAEKYKNGYHPDGLRKVPMVIVAWFLKEGENHEHK